MATKKHKPIFYLIIEMLVICCLVGSGYLVYAKTARRQIRIGATYMTMNNTFYQVLNEQIEKKTDEHDDVLYTRDPALSVNKQVQEIDDFIAKNVKVIIINPVDGNSQKLNAALGRAKKAGIKIIVVDSQMRWKNNVDVTITSQNYLAGKLCAEQLMKEKKRARILVLEHLSAMSANDRVKGFVDTIKKHPKYKIVARLNSWGQSEIAYPLVKKEIKQGPKFDTVMTLNDQVAVGALAAINNLKKNIDVYSIDGSTNMKQLILKSSHARVTVAQSPIKIGQEAVKAAYRLINGQKVKQAIYTPVYVIDKENIKNYNVSGWQ